MPTYQSSDEVVNFGPFEVRLGREEIWRGDAPVRLPSQPFQILAMLLVRPGQIVSREQLREQIWEEGTFVDFEHGLNAAINKLRRALGDSADRPRYIETIPGHGYRFIGVLERIALPTKDAPDPPIIPVEAIPTPRATLKWWVVTGVIAPLSFLFGFLAHKPNNRLSAWKYVRLTAESGLSNSPAISRDGTLVAYSSDQSGEGERDIYLKQVSGAKSIRLTFDGEGNTAPDFSPDGAKIVFHSDRDGGGIYEIPTFGGESRLIAREGQNPRFSPDGTEIAYWVGDENVASAVPGSGAVWVVHASGGQPRQVASNFTNARFPIWSPDGENLLVVGYTSDKAYDGTAIDWWLVPINGGQVQRTGAYESLIRAGLQARDIARDRSSLFGFPDMPVPSCWLATSDVIVFSLNGENQSLWEVDLSRRTGRVGDDFQRITAGAGNERSASCATPDLLAFNGVESRRNIWSVPFDLNHGNPKGLLERVTQTPARHDHVSVSKDGRWVVFASTRAGRLNIWLRDSDTGRERQLVPSSLVQRYPLISGSGAKIAFSVYEKNGSRSVYVSSPNGETEKVCEGCLRATGWSGDERKLLIFAGSPYRVALLDIVSHAQTVVLSHPKDSLLYARFSPDQRWVSFTDRTQPNRSRIMVAPMNGGKPVPESNWVQITEERSEDWANWSPDGNTLYFTSARDGHTCFWGQRLDPKSHKPLGPAFAAQHLHGRLTYQHGGWSASGNQIAMVALEDTGNVWIMSRH